MGSKKNKTFRAILGIVEWVRVWYRGVVINCNEEMSKKKGEWDGIVDFGVGMAKTLQHCWV